jgi:hypothetical protein
MGIFGDKWRNTRDDLAKVAKTAKAMLPNSVDDAVRLIIGGAPAEKKAYEPYLAYLSKGNAPDELKKFPPDVVDACALRLLSVATNKLELIVPGWSVSVNSMTLEDLAPQALPILDKLTKLLVEQKSGKSFLIIGLANFCRQLPTTFWVNSYPSQT